ncbi:rsph9 [Symbiodinium sp. CCMP2456]|nr:rsph9 [Symbiodinium sp. CCMP2456]
MNGSSDACATEREGLKQELEKQLHSIFLVQRSIVEQVLYQRLKKDLLRKMRRKKRELDVKEKLRMLHGAMADYDSQVEELRPLFVSNTERDRAEKRLSELQWGIGDTAEGKEMKQRWKMERLRRAPTRQSRDISISLSPGMRLMLRPSGLGNFQLFSRRKVGPNQNPNEVALGIHNDGKSLPVIKFQPTIAIELSASCVAAGVARFSWPKPSRSKLRASAFAAMNAEDLEGLPVSSGGHVLSCEEITCLQAGLALLKATEKNPVIQFWGKILGKERDYFIACEIRDLKPAYPNKRFFYAGEDFKFKAMPDLSEEVGEAVSMLQLTTPLTGDPSALLESVAGVEPKAGPALTELDRLALLVQEIDFDTATVPKGAYSLNEAQVVVPNSAFRGLEPAKATLLENYVHFRPPASVVSLKAQASNDLEFQSNFLDSLADDLPKGCWAVRQEPEKSGLVTLRSLMWPGYSAFHVPGTGKFGSVYFGYASKITDLAFLL